MNSTIQIAATGPLLPGEPTVRYVAGATVQAALGGAVYTIPAVPLTGADLLAHAGRFPMDFPSRVDLAAASGHVKPDGKINFISFYEALLGAKLEADPNYYVTIDKANEEDLEYNELSLWLQELYDAVYVKFGEKWDHKQIMEFMELLQDDAGIETAQGLEDRLETVVDNAWSWEKEFAEEYVNSLEYGLSDSIVYSSIDWQDVWDSLLKYDFNAIEFDDSVYIFRAN